MNTIQMLKRMTLVAELFMETIVVVVVAASALMFHSGTSYNFHFMRQYFVQTFVQEDRFLVNMPIICTSHDYSIQKRQYLF